MIMLIHEPVVQRWAMEGSRRDAWRNGLLRRARARALREFANRGGPLGTAVG